MLLPRKIYQKLWLLTVAALLSLPLNSQNVTSPYSILGIGDIETKDFGRYAASGHAAIARRDLSAYNFSNAASLTALSFKTMHLDVAFRGRSSTFLTTDADTVTRPTKDFTLKRISMAFKINQQTGLALGLRPYSTVNYRFRQNQAILDGNATYNKFVDGSGGMNQVYVSAGRMLSQRVSAGLTASWLFGSLQRSTRYTTASVYLDMTRKETDFYYGTLFQGGMQYYSLPGKNWRHLVGLTATVSSGLRGELTTEYIETDKTVKKETEQDRKFLLPFSTGLGYTAIYQDQLALSVEGNYHYWKYQRVEYPSSYTHPSVKFSAGMEYTIKKKSHYGAYEKGYIGTGVTIENSYLRIRGQHLWDLSYSLGGGLHLTRNITVSTGLELGTKGENSKEQIKETYTQFTLGITLKDLWFGTRKQGRYD